MKNMDRLTTEFCGEYVPRELCTIDRLGEADDCELCFENCKAFENADGGADCDGCAINECFNRLGEYENTGLTPEQIAEMDKLYAAKCRELAKLKENYLSGIELAKMYSELKALKKYRRLERQGRMLIAPCSVGQIVYTIGPNETKPVVGEVTFIRIGAAVSSLRIYVPEIKKHINRAFEQIGKSVFFDQAAAEEALAKRNEKPASDDVIVITGKTYSKKKLCLDWFKMDNESFFREYGFNFNPHKYTGLYDWGRTEIYGA